MDLISVSAVLYIIYFANFYQNALKKAKEGREGKVSNHNRTVEGNCVEILGRIIMGISFISYGKTSLYLRPTSFTTSPRELIEFVSQRSTTFFQTVFFVFLFEQLHVY